VITGWRRFSERLGGGASIFQELDLGEVLSAEAKLRPTDKPADFSRRISAGWALGSY